MKGIIFMKSLTLSAIINNAKREHESFQKEINDITASLLLTQEGKKAENRRDQGRIQSCF